MRPKKRRRCVFFSVFCYFLYMSFVSSWLFLYFIGFGSRFALRRICFGVRVRRIFFFRKMHFMPILTSLVECSRRERKKSFHRNEKKDGEKKKRRNNTHTTFVCGWFPSPFGALTLEVMAKKKKKDCIFSIFRRFCSCFSFYYYVSSFQFGFCSLFCVRSAWRKWSFFFCAQLLRSLIHFDASYTTNKYDLRIESHLVYMAREPLCTVVVACCCLMIFSALFFYISSIRFSFLGHFLSHSCVEKSSVMPNDALASNRTSAKEEDRERRTS